MRSRLTLDAHDTTGTLHLALIGDMTRDHSSPPLHDDRFQLPTRRQLMNTPRILILATTATAALFLAACGTERAASTTASGVDDGTKVLELTMTDMAFTPVTVQVNVGDTVHFRFRNEGKAIHEAVIGDTAFQQAHAEEMAAMAASGQTMHHGGSDEAAPLVVQPGQAGELTYTATTAGRLLIGCHQPGHWEAGMKATIDVD